MHLGCEKCLLLHRWMQAWVPRLAPASISRRGTCPIHRPNSMRPRAKGSPSGRRKSILLVAPCSMLNLPVRSLSVRQGSLVVVSLGLYMLLDTYRTIHMERQEQTEQASCSRAATSNYRPSCCPLPWFFFFSARLGQAPIESQTSYIANEHFVKLDASGISHRIFASGILRGRLRMIDRNCYLPRRS